MKVKFFTAFSLLFLLAITACKTTPKVDWESRVGNYTFDQAVTELGPPDKTARLTDGRTVADWIRRGRGGGMSFGVGTGFVAGATGVGVGTSTGTRQRDQVLRLTFDANNILVHWSKNY